jgi:hypothetical protein
MRILLDLDEVQARELERLLARGVAAHAIVCEAVAGYLAHREQLEHRRAVMEAILTGEPPAEDARAAAATLASQGGVGSEPGAREL